ncbi:MAG: VRR-NUC domain-containing protein [Phycisphaerae bacterium]|nr:VRR-NUC domain-containing protein [Phycisphaerae bacterium]
MIARGEGRIQAEVLRYLRSLGVWCWAFKAEVSSERGVPDIICCCRGRFVGLEVKSARGRISGPQRVQLERIQRARGRAAVVRSVEDVKRVLTEIDREVEGEGDP